MVATVFRSAHHGRPGTMAGERKWDGYYRNHLVLANRLVANGCSDQHEDCETAGIVNGGYVQQVAMVVVPNNKDQNATLSDDHLPECPSDPVLNDQSGRPSR